MQVCKTFYFSSVLLLIKQKYNRTQYNCTSEIIDQSPMARRALNSENSVHQFKGAGEEEMLQITAFIPVWKEWKKYI